MYVKGTALKLKSLVVNGQNFASKETWPADKEVNGEEPTQDDQHQAEHHWTHKPSYCHWWLSSPKNGILTEI